MQSKYGKFITNLHGEMQYQSYSPTPLPFDVQVDKIMHQQLSQVYFKLGYLKGKLTPVDCHLFTKLEAYYSTKMEGLPLSLSAFMNGQTTGTLKSYHDAIQIVPSLRSQLPLCNRFLKEVHYILMSYDVESKKTPGSFRHSQNWIGNPGSTLKDATYIPPNPDDMKISMNNLENFIHEDYFDPLIQAALLLYQFETILPFLAENGRMARLLLLFFLAEKELILPQGFVISYVLEKKQLQYFGWMQHLRQEGKIESWIQFFLTCLHEALTFSIQLLDIDKRDVNAVIHYIESFTV